VKLAGLLKHGAIVNIRDNSGDTPQHTAIVEGHAGVPLMTLLLDSGGDPNVRGALGRTLVHTAVWHGGPELVELLIQRGAHVNAVDEVGETPLHLATGISLAMVKSLLAAGAHVNVANEHGATPLHAAAKVDALETAELLLDSGANVNAHDAYGCTPLYFNYTEGSILFTEPGTVAGALLARGARHTIHSLVYLGDQAEVHKALEAGTDPNTRDRQGNTLRHLAARRGHSHVVQALLSRGGDC